MKIDVETITGINDIRQRVQTITPANIAAFVRSCAEKESHEIVVGTVKKPETRALFTLTRLLRAQRLRAKTDEEMADEEELAADFRTQECILGGLCDISNELAWFDTRSELGFWKACSVGLRKDWQIVEIPEPEEPDFIKAIRKRFGGE